MKIAMSCAWICVCATVEMRSPRPSETSKKLSDSTAQQQDVAGDRDGEDEVPIPSKTTAELHARHQDVGDQLSEHQAGRADRRHQELIERALLALAHDRKRREHDRDVLHHEANEAGHEEVRAAHRRIEEHDRTHFERRDGLRA